MKKLRANRLMKIRIESWLKFLVILLPAMLYFSYYPVIGFGSNDSMNFELSLPLIWLVVFDFVAFVYLVIFERTTTEKLRRIWLWGLLPVYLTMSVLWSMNTLRGALTVGILWLIYFTVYMVWKMRELFDVGFLVRFWRWFWIVGLVVCGWCLTQCILDLLGVTREYSLMCAGCTYKMFGFPHPNGFAIEPQFMGNLLLVPIVVLMWGVVNGSKVVRSQEDLMKLKQIRYGVILPKHAEIVLVIFAMTLFLTFSRGAIYAFGVAMVFLSSFVLARKKGLVLKNVIKMWGMSTVAFFLVLNMQGVMAAVGPTSDTYWSGVTKSLNHLSLGVIDLRGQDVGDGVSGGGIDGGETVRSEGEEEIEVRGEERDEIIVGNENQQEPMFDGYVAESTDTRMRLTNAAIEVWAKDWKNALFGVGLGGAGWALYQNGLSPAPKEIIQNQYASMLLEAGIVGIMLSVLTLILIMKLIVKVESKDLLLTMLVAFGVSLFFFAGLPNALHIYLMTAVLLVFCLRTQKSVD